MGSFVSRWAGWAIPLGVAWWVIVEGRPGSWGVGVPTVAAAAAIAAATIRPSRRWIRPGALLRFVVAFVAQSARGGVDVAWRALSPAMPLEPGFVEMRTTLPEGGARVLLADAVSLLPGTLCVELAGDVVVVHALDTGRGIERDFRALERRIAALVGLGAARGPR
jgi:multicomponent Na+:H+ antiporter subunit E